MRLPRLVLLLFLLFFCFSPSVCSQNSLLMSFRYPPKEFSPIPIWWWSGDKITEERLAWQMEKMVEGHIYNAIILNLYPTSDDPPYFSPRWWELMDFTLRKADELGMKIWFYDGLGFAESDIQNRLMGTNAEFKAEYLACESTDVTEGKAAELKLPAGRFIAACAAPILENSSLGEPKDLSAEFKGGVLKWTPLAGSWRVMLFYAMPSSRFDYSNAIACSKLIDSIHGEYERRYARYLGKTIPGSFQDELPPLPHWSKTFLVEFQKRKGYDLTPHLPALFYDCGPKTAKYRIDYRDVIASMCEDAFFKPLFEWHEKHGMICGMDQFIRNADPINAQIYYHDYFRTMRWFGAPGQDQHGDARPHASIAHLYGRPRVWLEGFYNSGWGQTLEELAQLVNIWYVRGANLYDPHAWYYSTAGGWWEWAPPCTSFRQPYWRHYKYFADYVARLSFLLSQGRHVCDIAVLYPSTTIHAEMTVEDNISDSAGKTAQRFWQTVQSLDKDKRDFDWIDEDSLQRAVCANGRLNVSSESYRVLILPRALYLKTSSAKKIEEFARSGGLVLVVDNAPIGSAESGRDDPEIQSLFAKLIDQGLVTMLSYPGIIPETLEVLLPRDHSPNIRCTHRAVGDIHFYFVLPESAGPWKITLSAKGQPEVWDPYTGNVYPVTDYSITDAGTEMTFNFDLSPAFFIVINPKATANEGKNLLTNNSQQSTAPQSPILQFPDEWDFRIYPTLDNRWGDFRLPASKGMMPVEVRDFRYTDDPKNEGLKAGWHKSNFDDSKWARAVYTFGPYWNMSDPIRMSSLDELEKPMPPEEWHANSPNWRAVVYSRQLGIEKDPIHLTTLGPKSRVPADFALVKFDEVISARYLSTFVYSPKARSATLYVSSQFPKRVWLNGSLVINQPANKPPVFSARVKLMKGWNKVLIKLAHDGAATERLSFSISDENMPSAKWIWAAKPEAPIVYFRKVLEVPYQPKESSINITCDNGYELYVNGKLIGREVGYDQSYWQTAEHFSIPLRKGKNIIAVKAINLGGPGGLVAWGEVKSASNKRLPLATNETWEFSTRWEPGWTTKKALTGWLPAKCLGSLDNSQWGKVFAQPASQNLKQCPAMPNFDLPGTIYDPNPTYAPYAWYRFKLPPGTIAIRPSVSVPYEIYVNGNRQVIGKDGVVRLKSPVSGGVCAIRAKQKPGLKAGAIFSKPIQFECAPGKITLGSWHEKGLSTYSGIGVYSRTFNLPGEYVGKPLILDLGEVRGTAEVRINGKQAGVRIWKPYRFEIGNLVRAGDNKVEIIVTNTLGPHYRIAMPTPYVYPGQEISGILGPVSLMQRENNIKLPN
ncbi:MAG: glycosyl hydrolase [Armatimonadota bacterium]|nr:glycosyl hydrolase [Armatimonadota bacterium]